MFFFFFLWTANLPVESKWSPNIHTLSPCPSIQLFVAANCAHFLLNVYYYNSIMYFVQKRYHFVPMPRIALHETHTHIFCYCHQTHPRLNIDPMLDVQAEHLLLLTHLLTSLTIWLSDYVLIVQFRSVCEGFVFHVPLVGVLASRWLIRSTISARLTCCSSLHSVRLHISLAISYFQFWPLLRQPPTSYLLCPLHI